MHPTPVSLQRLFARIDYVCLVIIVCPKNIGIKTRIAECAAVICNNRNRRGLFRPVTLANSRFRLILKSIALTLPDGDKIQNSVLFSAILPISYTTHYITEISLIRKSRTFQVFVDRPVIQFAARFVFRTIGGHGDLFRQPVFWTRPLIEEPVHDVGESESILRVIFRRYFAIVTEARHTDPKSL